MHFQYMIDIFIGYYYTDKDWAEPFHVGILQNRRSGAFIFVDSTQAPALKAAKSDWLF